VGERGRQRGRKSEGEREREREGEREGYLCYCIIVWHALQDDHYIKKIAVTMLTENGSDVRK
jgi:hypothetical protein